jgi:deoxyribonuclease IV
LKNRYFGCHVSAAGGLHKALERGERLGVNTIQVHPSPPQKWNIDPFKAKIEDDFLDLRKNSCVKKVFFHGIYLINLATPDERKQRLAVKSLKNYLDLLSRIGGEGVIFHVGSLKDEPDEELGFRRCAALLMEVIESTPEDSKLLLEVSAGSGKVIGSSFSQLAKIYEYCDKPDRIGFALDSQHMWASGYDLANDLAAILDTIEKQVGLTKIGAIHLNDSKSERGSCVDRHANLGEGTIGLETLTKLVRHPALVDIPFILETPRMKEIEEAAIDVAVLREMANIS